MRKREFIVLFLLVCGVVEFFVSPVSAQTGANESEREYGIAAEYSVLRSQALKLGAQESPDVSRVRFYMVTPHGVLTAEVDEEDLGYGRHAFAPLFQQGIALATAIRGHSE